MKNRKYCIYFQTRNHYQLFEKLMFAKTKTSFNNLFMINQDCGSSDEQKKLAKKVCDKYGIHWINEHDSKTYPMQKLISQADDWLTKNGHDFDWIIRVHNDAYPIIDNFWDKLDSQLEKNNDLFLEKVGSFCFSENINGFYGRGNLEKNVLLDPHGGWYKHLPKWGSNQKYNEVDYFVVESPLDWAKGYNRKLFKKYIKIDEKFQMAHADDDISHQFMLNGIYNICFPKLIYKHDIRGKNLFTNYTSMSLPQESAWKRFHEKWKWQWGRRNRDVLRQQFKDNCLNDFKYKKSIQKIMFNRDIYDGPKDINYYELNKN